MKIQFLGAAGDVTGSKHLITTDAGIKILLDCGLYQGKGENTYNMNKNLGFFPEEIDYLILSHAHIDHSGLIPYIYDNGFKGQIICSSATRNLCSIMLPDSGYIQENDTKWYNKKMLKAGKETVTPLYTHKIAIESIKNFMSVPMNKEITIHTGVKLIFTSTGHMLGGAVINLSISEWGKTTRIAYTGDIGRPTPKILLPPEKFPQCDYLIIESTYGNRLHPTTKASEEKLYQVIKDCCEKKKGKLIIPSFSVGRTQEIIYTLNKLFNEKKLKNIDVFVDSPLSVNATEIFRLHNDCFNKEVQEMLYTDDNIFGFTSLRYVKNITESKRLNKRRSPCIIISASGMAEAGRVKHHIANSISSKKNTILIVGYCTPTSLGARIQDKTRKSISIFGIEHKIKADIERIESYSGHGDYKEMIKFINCQNKDEIKEIFLVHGEDDSRNYLKKELIKVGYKNITIPKLKDEKIIIIKENNGKSTKFK